MAVVALPAVSELPAESSVASGCDSMSAAAISLRTTSSCSVPAYANNAGYLRRPTAPCAAGKSRSTCETSKRTPAVRCVWVSTAHEALPSCRFEKLCALCCDRVNPCLHSHRR